jgi:tRNA(His) guanylyltransferase
MGNLHERMKLYEAVPQLFLTARMPMILRVDGRAFHTLTQHCERPFDPKLNEAMAQTAVTFCHEIDGAQLAYVQSDEISILAVDYSTLDSAPWFGGNVQKITSVSASVATVAFNRWALEHDFSLPSWAMFDARVFVLPKEDVVNDFVWRQQDWNRNSLNMFAQAYCSHAELRGLSKSQVHEKLFTERGVNWAHLPTHLKNGLCVYRVPRVTTSAEPPTIVVTRQVWEIDREPPVFAGQRAYIERHVYVEGIPPAGL